MEKLLLDFYQSPGDVLVGVGMTLESLHRQFPNQYQTAVKSCCPGIYENNPLVSKEQDGRYIKMEYPLINESDNLNLHFGEAYCRYLGKELGIPLTLQVNRPVLHLTKKEMSYASRVHEITGRPTKHWLVNVGYKEDRPAKKWIHEYYQEVVTYFARKGITWVQVGEIAPGHSHPPLFDVIDQRGKTNTREFIRLCGTSSLGLGPVTFMHHIYNSWCPPYLPKPYICINPTEPNSWIYYPGCTIISPVGKLNCCKNRACWKSGIMQEKKEDGTTRWRLDQLCVYPMFSGGEPVTRCSTIISPERVIEAINFYIEGGTLIL